MVSTRGNTSSGTSSTVELPQKRASISDASKRPTKKAKANAVSDLVVGQTVSKDVTLLNQDQKEIKFLDTFRDQGVVFFMYPRANTPGCTKQACGFRDNIETIKKAGFAVYGLSGDSPKVLNNWKTKQNLPFDLLSDPKHELISYFGSSLSGNKVQRSHVVILKGGQVGEVTGAVSPADSVSRAVKFVEENSRAATIEEDPANEEAPAKEDAPAKEEPATEMPATEEPATEEPAKEDERTDASKFAVGNTITLDVELENELCMKTKVQDLFKKRGAIFFMFPKANTSGCTTHACRYNDNLEAFIAADFDVYGLGADPPADLRPWKESMKYKYTFLSDPNHQLISYFGSSFDDGTRVERSHVIVLPGGKVGQIEHNISPEDSVSKALEFIQSHAIDTTSKL
ncbi:hypothetical protein PsorP6_008051 [Peronosclerospora sorghi]|uniref:Uncharacterized protein n=1 Tax=Peronosclerospora sorghi TaxID=230839 RepID=A0ACC0W9P1_9STRA|nr:hypothetical protein PsorP6_008051 [Peronosclerospora sorghi]